ncbi:hypothetical protein [Leifsonia sp. 21MFCrub1.1]|nr:hypothetical protein [Leifsonia sp. 21MFCrub1.1]
MPDAAGRLLRAGLLLTAEAEAVVVAGATATARHQGAVGLTRRR